MFLQHVLALDKGRVFAHLSQPFLSRPHKGIAPLVDSCCQVFNLLSLLLAPKVPFTLFLSLWFPHVSYFLKQSYLHPLNFFQQVLEYGLVIPCTLSSLLIKVMASLYCWTQLSIFILHLNWIILISFLSGCGKKELSSILFTGGDTNQGFTCIRQTLPAEIQPRTKCTIFSSS